MSSWCKLSTETRLSSKKKSRDRKKEFAELDRQYQDLNNAYDRDKALWEGKFKFLEQQRDTAKKDCEDA